MSQYMRAFLESRGTTYQPVERQRQLLEAAGFVDIQESVKTIDLGSYGQGRKIMEVC
jgi:hypothetical protein